MAKKKTPEVIEDKNLDEASGGTSFAVLLGSGRNASEASITDGTSTPTGLAIDKSTPKLLNT